MKDFKKGSNKDSQLQQDNNAPFNKDKNTQKGGASNLNQEQGYKGHINQKSPMGGGKDYGKSEVNPWDKKTDRK